VTRRTRNVRVYAVGAVFTLSVAALWCRLAQVQYVHRAAYQHEAQKQREAPRVIPAVRGGIFDRNGRPLALSADLCSVSISPEEVSSRNHTARAVAKILGVSQRTVKQKLSSKRSFEWIKRQCALSQEAIEKLDAIDGVNVLREPGRVYPYGQLANKVVGLVGYDLEGMAGIEAAFNDELSGVAGEALVIRNGAYRTDRYQKKIRRRPINGHNLYLTLDAVVQEIAETELARAIRTHGAKSGALIVMEIETGDVLALAEFPIAPSRVGNSRADSLWTIRSVSHVYEPGSTFKIVTAAALLETRSVEEGDMFDAENGRANLGFAVIRDPHPHAELSFLEAFEVSSNIVMAKAAQRVDAEDFYKYMRVFGFGSKTGLRLLGESSGRVPVPSEWSERTQGTIAFGQEIAVTPMQMLCAVAAVANDGVMMMPRIVKGVTSEDGSEKIFETVRVRHVVSKKTADVLRRFCRGVVTSGTGTQAGLDFMTVAGKTGTAQKASRAGGYIDGRYISSFMGFAPYDDPRIACLVLLDEPNYASRYGGDSAAPAFARVLRGIANSTDLLDDALDIASIEPPSKARKKVQPTPNFLRLERAVALERARRIGANVLCQGDQGRVVAQDPDPGVSIDRDAVIRLFVSDSKTDTATRRVPDLTGLSMRAAKLAATKAGMKARFVGTGTVERQSPSPGTGTRQQIVKLYCKGNGAAAAGGSM